MAARAGETSARGRCSTQRRSGVADEPPVEEVTTMKTTSSKSWIGALALASMLGVALVPSVARAGEFAEKHPRRAEVNRREHHQQDRIANGMKSGKLNASEAANLEGQEANLKAQEKAEVKQNGGYLTKGEQQQLNHEENGISRQIHQDKTN
jgi:hypothetical protein